MERLQAAFDLLVGRYPRGKAVEQPYFFGSGIGAGGQKRSGLPAQRISIQKLRRFSETPIPRRLINYIRSQITRLAWGIEPLDGVTLNRQQQERIQQLKRVLRDPNPDDSWDSWLGALVDDMLVVGWGVSEVRQFPAGGEDHPYLLWPVDGASIQIDREWDGAPRTPRYWQTNYMRVTPGDDQDIPFLNNELMVMKYTPRTSTPFGLAPIEVAITEISYLLDAMAFAGRTASSAQPKKLLFFKGMSTEQLREYREYWHNVVLGSGEMPMMSGEDAQTLELGLVTDQNLFLKWQEFLIAVIADAFGVDVQKVNLIVGINRSTGDTLDDATDESVIAPLAATIEQYVNKFLLPLFDLADVAEFKFRFTTSNTDRKNLAVVHQMYAQMDTLTIDEIRAEMGKPPLVHPKTSEPLGGYTLSAYRAMWKSLQSTVDGPEEANKAIQEQFNAPPNGETVNNAEKSSSGSNKESGENSNNTNPDESQRGGNGVYSSSKPKDKPLNRADERDSP